MNKNKIKTTNRDKKNKNIYDQIVLLQEQQIQVPNLSHLKGKPNSQS